MDKKYNFNLKNEYSYLPTVFLFVAFPYILTYFLIKIFDMKIGNFDISEHIVISLITFLVLIYSVCYFLYLALYNVVRKKFSNNKLFKSKTKFVIHKISLFILFELLLLYLNNMFSVMTIGYIASLIVKWNALKEFILSIGIPTQFYVYTLFFLSACISIIVYDKVIVRSFKKPYILQFKQTYERQADLTIIATVIITIFGLTGDLKVGTETNDIGIQIFDHIAPLTLFTFAIKHGLSKFSSTISKDLEEVQEGKEEVQEEKSLKDFVEME